MIVIVIIIFSASFLKVMFSYVFPWQLDEMIIDLLRNKLGLTPDYPCFSAAAAAPVVL